MDSIMKDVIIKISNIVNQREDTYGNFESNSLIATDLKASVRQNSRWKTLSYNESEAIDQICSKISRIVCSKTPKDRMDSWYDIMGYSMLAISSLERECKFNDMGEEDLNDGEDEWNQEYIKSMSL